MQRSNNGYQYNLRMKHLYNLAVFYMSSQNQGEDRTLELTVQNFEVSNNFFQGAVIGCCRIKSNPVLSHLLVAAHSLDRLLCERSVWAGPFTRPLICYMGEVQNLKYYDLVYENRELGNLNFWSPEWEQNGKGKQVAGFTNSVE